MKPVNNFCIIFICLLMLLSGSIYSETKKTLDIFNSRDGKIKIGSISYKMDMNKLIGTFSGDVEVESDDITMSCQKLDVYFKNSGKGSSVNSSDIEKIVATESIVIKHSDGSYAAAEKAEYIIESEKILLTGNPYFTDGKGREGRAPVRLILDLKEKSIIAEGTKEDKATLSSTGKDER